MRSWRGRLSNQTPNYPIPRPETPELISTPTTEYRGLIRPARSRHVRGMLMAPGRRREHIDPGRAWVTRSLTIPMPFVHEEDHDAAGRHAPIFVEPVSGLWLRNIAEQLARCFTRSTPFDGGIYSARYPGPIVVVLLPMGYTVGDGTHYSGAIGVHP